MEKIKINTGQTNQWQQKGQPGEES